jgi:outer membrane protein
LHLIQKVLAFLIMIKSAQIIFFALMLLCMGFTSTAQTKKWTLQECVEYGIKNNISIKQSSLDVENADIDKSIAIGNFLPNINANASHSWNIGLNQNITTGLLENQTIQFTSAGLSSNVDIYNGLQNQNRFQRAKMAQLAAQYQLSKMKDDISLNIANSFLQILFSKENLKIQQEQLANDEKQLTRTDELVKAGNVPRGDMLDMKATVAADRQRVIVAENNLLLSKLSLAQLLQLEDFQNFDIAEGNYDVFKSVVMEEKPEVIIEKAMQQRIEIKIAKANLELAERDIKIAKGAYQPSITGFYQFSTRAANSPRFIESVVDTANPTRVIGVVEGTGQNVLQPNFNAVFGNAASLSDQFSLNKGHNFGLQLNVPIFNGFAARNNVERSKVALERAKNTDNQTKLDLQRNVFTAITDAKGALNTYESAMTTLEARSEAFNYAKERYAVGMMNGFDFNQSQTLFVNAQSELIRAKYDYIFKVKVVEFYFGIPILEK